MNDFPGGKLAAKRRERKRAEKEVAYPGSVIPQDDDSESDSDDEDDEGLVPFEKAIMALFFAGFFMVVLMAVGLGKVSPGRLLAAVECWAEREQRRHGDGEETRPAVGRRVHW